MKNAIDPVQARCQGLGSGCLAFAIAFLVACSTPVWGVPAEGGARTVAQPDGTPIAVRLLGDEVFSWHETSDGYVVALDEADGWWKYAVPLTDRAGFRLLDAKVGRVTPESLGLSPHALPAAPLVRRLREQTRPTTRVFTTPSCTDTQRTQPEDLTQPSTHLPAESRIRNVVILACYADQWDGRTVSPAYGRPRGDYDDLINQVGYQGKLPGGSLRDCVCRTSSGRLRLQALVTEWVRLPHDRAYYAAIHCAADRQQLAVDAVAAADAAGLDFSQGDGDGGVDVLTVLHSGIGLPCENSAADSTGPGILELGSFKSLDGVSVKRYHTLSALRDDSTNLPAIDSLCAEIARLPDLPASLEAVPQPNGERR